VAILIEALTDNRNRTAADLRSAFSKNGGNLGETGCVSWMFSHKGVVTLTGEIDEEALLEASLIGEAEGYSAIEDSDEVEVLSAVENLEHLNQTLQDAGFTVKEAELRWFPETEMNLTDEVQIQTILKMIETIEALDDVQTVTSNLAIAPAFATL